mgnify:CR=1 FL=1
MNRILNTTFRFYQNKEIIVLGNLKVGSRFIDELGIVTYSPDFQEEWETTLHYADGGNFVDTNSYRKGMFQQKFQPIYDTLENKDSRKVFLIYRNPIMRIQSAFSHFFIEWLKQSISVEILPISVEAKEYIVEHESGVLQQYVPVKFIQELFPWMKRFVNYFTTERMHDQHVTNYLHIWNQLANKIDSDRLNLINIDEQRLEKVFNTDIPKDDNGNPELYESNPLIKKHFKDMICNNEIIKTIISTEIFHFNNLEKIRNV